MLRNNPQITDLMYESVVETLARLKGITLSESRDRVSKMSFLQYHTLVEAGANITPPSGQTIGPAGPTGSTNAAPAPGASTTSQPAQTSPQKTQVMWNGPGSPVEQGMTVGLKGTNGVPVPGEITQVDQGANGVKVRNPTTGQEEWHSNDELEPYAGGQTTPGATPQAAGLQQQQMAEDIKRMKQLAGIAEDASGGASCAGAMGASTPQPLGKKMQRRAMPENSMDEYTPTVAKTVVGDTKPHQDSGKLSARLAKAGKPTASRTNNGFKK